MFDLPEGKFQKNHHFYGKVDIKLPTWEDIIDNLNLCAENEVLVGVLEYGGYVMHDTFSENLRYLNSIAPNMTLDYFVSLTTLSKTFGKHKDIFDVWWISGIGETEITVWDEKEITYIMKPGDMIYLPKGMYHNTKPLTPRVGLSFGIDYEN